VLDAIETVEVTHEDKKLDFKWGIKTFSPRKVTLKIDFDDPLEVSDEVNYIFFLTFSPLIIFKLNFCRMATS
jgi:hypothetical protein